MMVDIDPEIAALETALGDLEAEKDKIESILLDFTQLEKISRRIEERQNDLIDAAIAFEDAEAKLMLLEQFSRKKSEFIENNVNNKFAVTKWKLFEEQINGGIREICEATRDGVPYATDLNTGGRIQVGIDVINVLSAYYGIIAPVFVDNAESVTDWAIESQGQMIRLTAAANVDKLEVIL